MQSHPTVSCDGVCHHHHLDRDLPGCLVGLSDLRQNAGHIVLGVTHNHRVALDIGGNRAVLGQHLLQDRL